MAVKPVYRGGKWRVVESHNGRVTTNAKGTVVDGGGHSDAGKAARQANAINENLQKKEGE